MLAGSCQAACNVEACGYDGKDCECADGCDGYMFRNGNFSLFFPDCLQADYFNERAPVIQTSPTMGMRI